MVVQDLNLALCVTGDAHWGKEVGVASRAGRLHKFVPSGHKIWAIRTLPVSIAGLEASGS